jgi:hypothetical protein
MAGLASAVALRAGWAGSQGNLRFGLKLGLPYARSIEADPWELRAGAARLVCFVYVNHRFHMLHDYRKQSPPGGGLS